MTRKLSISSTAFEDLIRRLPDYVDFIVTADKTHKFLELDDVTYVAPLEEVAS